MESKLVRKVFCATVTVAILATSISCDRRDPNLPKVAAAIRKFNGRFNAGQFQEIYADADSRFQQSVSENDFKKKVGGLLQEHGPIQSTSVNGFEDMTRWQRLFPETKPTRFLGVYSHCRDGGFQELFEFDVTGEEAKLLKFNTSIEDANRDPQH
jgi:hypothetical protein